MQTTRVTRAFLAAKLEDAESAHMILKGLEIHYEIFGRYNPEDGSIEYIQERGYIPSRNSSRRVRRIEQSDWVVFTHHFRPIVCDEAAFRLLFNEIGLPNESDETDMFDAHVDMERADNAR